VGEVTYPENVMEWKKVIDSGLTFDKDTGAKLLASREFPLDKLEKWIRAYFTVDIGPVFVDAVVRNIKGLARWVYGTGSEPSWPGRDRVNPGLQKNLIRY